MKTMSYKWVYNILGPCPQKYPLTFSYKLPYYIYKGFASLIVHILGFIPCMPPCQKLVPETLTPSASVLRCGRQARQLVWAVYPAEH
jgi:hypothetical protein